MSKNKIDILDVFLASFPFRNLGYAITRVDKSNGISYTCANVTGP